MGRKIKTITITMFIIVSISMFIILYYTHYAYSNAGIVSDSTDDSWVGYDYNTETWIDMSDVNNDADVLLKSLDGNEVIHDGNIYLNDDEPDESSIFGDDDRSVVNMKNDSTSKGIVWLHSITTGDSMNTCSGNLIAENYVLTAAHCVTPADTDTSKFNRMITAYVGRSNGVTHYGYYRVKRAYVPQAWRINGVEHNINDIAVIEINKDINGKYPTDYGAKYYGYGWFDKDFKGEFVSFIGYPSDKWIINKNMDTMWFSGGEIDNSLSSFIDSNINEKINYHIDKEHNFTYKIDSSQGTSGGCLRFAINKQFILIGVNTSERAYKDDNGNNDPHKPYSYNSGVRITKEYYSYITSIIGADNA